VPSASVPFLRGKTANLIAGPNSFLRRDPAAIRILFHPSLDLAAFHATSQGVPDQRSSMFNSRFPPSKDQIAALSAFEGLGMDNISLVTSASQAEDASEILMLAGEVGFDTESKPTFRKGEKSEGPHVLQFSTRERAFIFQSHVQECQPVIAKLLESIQLKKIGFGLRGDLGQIWERFSIRPNGILDLDQSFKSLGYRNPVGAKSAIAILFERRLQKSKRITTTNWSNKNLTDEQLIYAANDAYAALLVHHALKQSSQAI